MEKRNLIISQENSEIFIQLYHGIILIDKNDIPLILDEWGFSDIPEEWEGSQMISFWENDNLIFQNNWGKRISFNRDEFINLFLN